MNSKLLGILSAGAVFLSLATPAFASSGLSITNLGTTVLNNVSTSSNTGFNYVGGSSHHGGGSVLLGTGMALSQSDVGNTVNLTSVSGCGCSGKTKIQNTNTNVTNNVLTGANSGFNSVSGGKHGVTLLTGDAGSGATVVNDVNTTIVGSIE
jgi:hypothetical protein